MNSDIDYKLYYTLRDIARDLQETNVITADQMTSVLLGIAEIYRRTKAIYNMTEDLYYGQFKKYYEEGEGKNGRTGKKPLRDGSERP